MRLLLDECIPRKLKEHLIGHECFTVPEAGFAGKKNGELLELAEQAGFNVLITLDRGIEYQQNLRSRKLAISFSSAANPVGCATSCRMSLAF
jgi:hypothetical protein